VQIIHFGHSCVLLDTGSARLLFDPGAFSSDFEGVRDLDAILITHQHFDHLDGDRLPALVEANPTAALIVDEDTVAETTKLGLTAKQVEPGDKVIVAGATVTAVGGRPATIHPDFAMPTNAGYVVDDGAFYHPGDALFVPEQDIDVLGLPMGAPWLKTAEVIDFLRAVRPRRALPIHEALLTDAGRQVTKSWITRLNPDAELLALPRGEATDV